jgi:predicted permease
VTRPSAVLIRLSALAVPRDLRRDWTEHWLGELDAFAGAGATRRELLVFALGAPRHAAIEALDEWTAIGLGHDIRGSLRRLAHEPVFTAACVAIVAIAVTANAAIFSVVNATLLRTPPGITRGDRLVQIGRAKADGGFDGVSIPVLDDMRAAVVPALVGLAAYDSDRFVVDDGAGARVAAGQLVTSGFFALLGALPSPGREFTPEEERRGEAVAVIAHDLWRRRFGSDASAIGASLLVNGVRARIVGVAPPAFVGPDAGTAAPEIWLPAGFGERRPWLSDRRRSWIWPIGRLRDGASIAQVRAQLAPVNDAIERAYPGTMGVALGVAAGVGLQPDARRQARAITSLLMGTVAVVLVIACANVASLLLARAFARRRDLAVRVAIGASRARIFRESLVESALLALLGGAAAAACCGWAAAGVRQLLPYELAVGFEPDRTVFAFTLACASVTGLALGILPARQASRTDLTAVIREGATSRTTGRTRVVLLVLQLALSFALVAGTAVLVRSLVNARLVRPGLDPDGVATVTVSLGRGLSESARAATVDALVARVRRLPGVAEAAVVSRVPIADPLSRRSVTLPDAPPAPSDGFVISPAIAVDPAYFRVVRVPIVRGRSFDARDGSSSDKVAIVSTSLARRLWGDGDPIGRALDVGPDRVRIVGVAADAAATSLLDRAMALVYQPFAQQRSGDVTLLARVADGLSSESLSAAAAVAGIAPGIPVVRAVSMRALLFASLADTRLTATLLALYGGASLLLATVGLYALLLHSTRQRRKEFSVRLALGAAPGRLRRSVLAGALRMIAAGVALGLIAALAGGRVIEHLLLGVGAADPLALASTVAVFVTGGLAASALPAWRATRIDPAASLRQD